jgi:hypothetical protein
MNTQNFYKILSEVNIKAIRVGVSNSDLLFERALSGGMMSLLMEQDEEGKQFDNADATKLQTQVKETIAAIDELASATQKMTSLKAILDGLKKGLPDDGKIGALVSVAPEKLPAAVADVSKKMSQVAMTKAAITNMLRQFGESLADPISKLSNEDRQKTLGELAAQSSQAGGKIKSGDKEVEFPTTNSLAKALQKAYTVPNTFMQAIERGAAAAKGESGSFFDKGFAAIKSLFGGETKPPNLKFDGIAEDFMKMTALEISGDFLQKLQNAEREAAARAQQESEAQAGAAASAAADRNAASGGEKASGEAGGAVVKARADLLRNRNLEQWSKLASEEPKEFAELVNAAAGSRILATEASGRWAQLAGLKENKRR